MEILKLKKGSLQKALNQLKSSLDDYKKEEYAKIYDKLRDSVIQRFEFCYDTLWKFLKIYLEQTKHISINPPTPRRTFRGCLEHNLISEKELSILINMAADRNAASHTYNERLAEHISARIPAYYETTKQILANLSK